MAFLRQASVSPVGLQHTLCPPLTLLELQGSHCCGAPEEERNSGACLEAESQEKGFEGEISAGVGERARAGTPKKKMWRKPCRLRDNKRMGGDTAQCFRIKIEQLSNIHMKKVDGMETVALWCLFGGSEVREVGSRHGKAGLAQTPGYETCVP